MHDTSLADNPLQALEVPSPKKEARINGVQFWPIAGVEYAHDYTGIVEDIYAGKLDERTTFRELILTDLWFVNFFAMKMLNANHPFWIKCCREVETGPRTRTLDEWSREHGKTSIITIGETIQDVLRDPEERVGLFAYKLELAKAFLRSIKHIFEESEFLKALFPDILYENPSKDAPKWSEYDGLILKREGFYKESTIEAAGLIDGMPTGRHYTIIKRDDFVTQDLVDNPEIIDKVIDRFELSRSLGTDGGRERNVGTPYHHADVLHHCKEKKDADGNPFYYVRTKPATVDGEPNGEPVFVSQERLDEVKLHPRTFFTQWLLDPTPKISQVLNPSYLKIVLPEDVPKQLWKFMLIDPAGFSTKKTPDSWAIMIVGVNPRRDELGMSDIYVLDAVIEPMSEARSKEVIVSMYVGAGRVMKVGVEKAAISTMETHVANALLEAGCYISIKDGTLVILRPMNEPGETGKPARIVRALQSPLNAGKIHILETVERKHRERLQFEMQKFPFWKDDGLDALHYVYQLIKEYKFPSMHAGKYDNNGRRPDGFRERKRNDEPGKNSWMGA